MYYSVKGVILNTSKFVFLAVCLLALFSNVSAVIPNHTMKVFAVTEDGQTAMTADLGLTIELGSGSVWTNIEPLIGTSTQTTEKTSVKIARNYFNNVDSYDFKFDINSNASLVDGPSAGAAMALLTISMLTDKKVPANVGITGTITNEGGVGQVGGVFKKSQEAARIGIKLFMVPVGESKQTLKTDAGVESINLIEYAEANWGMKVVEVKDIDMVLHFAFSDIDAIDTNSADIVIPDFIPEPLLVSGHLEKMQQLTQGYIQKAEDSVRKAKGALTGTLLNDPGAIDVLLATLNNADDGLQQAKILYDQKYLYSAANYAFLAQVNASFVNDISVNPSLLDSSSTAFDIKKLELRKGIGQLKKDMGAFVALEDWEWNIAARQRLSWAEHELDAILDDNTIVIQINGVSANALGDIQSYEFALAWFEASKSFFEMASDSETMIKSKPVFEKEIDAFIAGTENNLASLDELESEDIIRRLETAKKEKEQNWNIAALMDSASAFALSKASIFIRDKDLGELESVLEQKISVLEHEMAGRNFVWAQLYLDHAKYYSKGVDFYKGQGLNARALEMAKSGVSLVFLAEEVFNASKNAQDYFSSVPADELLDNILVPTYTPEGPDFWLIVILLVIAIALFSSFFILRFVLKLGAKPSIESIERARARLDELFSKKKISHAEYIEAHSILDHRLREIKMEKGALSKSVVEIDTMKFEVQALQKTLLEIKRQRKKRIVTKKDFEKNSKVIGKRIAELKKSIEEHRKDIAAEKARITVDLKKYGKEAKVLSKQVKKKKPKATPKKQMPKKNSKKPKKK